ncbi:MAG: Fe(2+) transporter permease subunit FeoB [Verrucomicrobia bacterium]|jgi:ferrous iron transport protein B|nr:Fe(2+) transporter permease subunit FeoB [Verrucomicrobiota bacterium]
MKRTTIAIAGNPNCGKTTVFNALTGSRQRVGNWPGVTVERLEGNYRHDDSDVLAVDLPGIYSFSANSPDEEVARSYILDSKPDVVVNILDATNLERNLYLTTQLLDMKVPLVVGLNMMDLAEQRHLHIEIEHLAKHLDCPVVPIIASKGKGIDALKAAVSQVAQSHHISSTNVVYDSEVEVAVERLRPLVSEAATRHSVADRWLAIKLLEEDPLAAEITANAHAELVNSEIARISRHVGDSTDIVLADGRYGFIHGLARDVLHRKLELRRTVTDLIDRVILNRALGIPLFFLIMYAVFFLTVGVGAPFIDFFDTFCGTVFVDGVRALLESLHAPAMLVTFLADGIGSGIQTISTFIPPIFFIFFCLAILEDSGYMSRAAFVMDRLLRTVGLPGKAFIPMLVGFGCNVPGIMATRTLENERDRRMAIIMNPFMSCGARLPVYTMFAVVFFPKHGSLLIFGLYLTGILLAVLTGLLLKRTLMPGEPSTFVMELPPYHVPTLAGIMHHTWHRLKGFIVRAGRVILTVVILMSLLSAVDGMHADSKRKQGIKANPETTLSRCGKFITPILSPMGIEEDNWPATVGLIAGVFAKEAVAGTLDSLYRQDIEESSESFSFWGGIADAFAAIPAGFSALIFRTEEEGATQSPRIGMRNAFGSTASVVAYLLFVLLYCPCLAVVGAVYGETNLRWATFTVGYLTLLAWVVATLFYQVATFAAHPESAALWISVCLGIMAAGVVGLRAFGRRIH